MKKLVESIQRRFDAAMKDAAGRDEKKRIAGKACCYQLAAVQALIEERIVCCKDCISYESLEQLVRENSIDEVTAEAEHRLGNTGMCLASLNEAFVGKKCSCGGYEREGRLLQLKEALCGTVGEDCSIYDIQPLEEGVVDFLYSAGILVVENHIQKISVDVDGATVKIGVSPKGVVKVDRKESRKVSAEC